MNILGQPLADIHVPVIDPATGTQILAPLRHSQIASLERRHLPLPQSRNQPTDRESRSLLALAMGLGKTMVFSLQAIEAISETGRPAFYSVWRTAILDDVQEEFTRAFRHFVGRDPIIHRYPDDTIDHTQRPDLIMGTPQFYYSYEFYEGHKHPSLSHHFSFAAFDEAHHWPAQKHLGVLHDVNADHKLGLTGTLDRMDDPHLGHRVIDIFGQPRYKRLLEDAVASGEVNKPDYRLCAVNIGPLLHEVLRGNFSHLTLNKSILVPELNASYEREFRKHYKELSKPQSIIVCKSIAHLKQMEELLSDLNIYAIHSQMSEVHIAKNKKAFFDRHAKGSVALVVDMWNEGVNFPHLGLMMQTATTMSRSKFFQTLGRCTRSDVRFVDVTMSQAHIAHVRLFHDRVNEIARSSDEIVPLSESASGIRIDDSVQKFEDVLKLQEMKEDFFFALGAAGLVQHLRRTKDHHKNVILDVGTDVRMENGMIVRLLDKESVNVGRWHRELPRDPDGKIVLPPAREQLLRTLGISDHELSSARFSQRRPANTSRSKKPELEPEKYFESEEFWAGFTLFKASFRRSSFDFTNVSDLRHGSAVFFDGNFTKIFDGQGRDYPEPIPFEFYEHKFPLYNWYQKTQEHLAFAADDVRTKILEAGIFFPDPEFIDAFARIYENYQREYESHIGTILRTFNDERTRMPEPGFVFDRKCCIFDEGTTIHLGEREVTIPCDMYVPVRVMLQRSHSPNAVAHLSQGRYDQPLPAFSRETPGAATKEEILTARAHDFSRSDYFWMGVETYRRYGHEDDLSPTEICRFLHNSVRREFEQVLDDPQDIFLVSGAPPMRLSEWRTDVKKSYPYLPEDIKDGLTRLGISLERLKRTRTGPQLTP
jgi:superfamily II DNA or RNA helicase